MRLRPLLPIAVLGACAVALSACGERGEPTGALTQRYPVTVQGAGEEPASLASPPQRIVALDAGGAELVEALGAADRLAGAPAGTRVDGLQPAPVVRRTGQIDVDAVVELSPDLVLAAPETDRVALAQIERQSGAAVYIQPARSIEDVEQAALDLGFLLGTPAEARQLVGRLEHAVQAVDARIADTQPVTVFVDTGFGATGSLLTVPGNSLLAALVARSHGENVAADADGTEPVPVSELAAADPDVILTTSDSGTTLAKLRRDPRLSRLAAVRSGRVVTVPAELVGQAGPRVARAYETVAAAIHPDAFR